MTSSFHFNLRETFLERVDLVNNLMTTSFKEIVGKLRGEFDGFLLISMLKGNVESEIYFGQNWAAEIIGKQKSWSGLRNIGKIYYSSEVVSNSKAFQKFDPSIWISD